MGAFPGRFAEWNDHYRDDMRRFWLQSGVSLGQFARRFAASSDVYNQRGRAPYATVNMLTAHDGFTLQDVVSFNEKHNQPNGEGNRDGSDRNFSNNHGVEGRSPTTPLCNAAGPASGRCSPRCCCPWNADAAGRR